MFRTAPEVPGLLLPESGRLRYAFLLQRRGDARARGLIGESETRVRARISAGDLAAATFMEAGVARALVGDANGAFAELQRAYDAGWRDYGIAAIDPMLAAVRDDPRFRALVDRARTNVAMQRERARQRGLLDFAPLLGRSQPVRQRKSAETQPAEKKTLATRPTVWSSVAFILFGRA